MIRFILAVTLLAVTPLRAQIVNDGAANTLSNVTNPITGDVTVGTNGSFTLLVLSDNSLLTNSGSGLIGLNATAKSNEVQVISPTARWLMGTNAVVGNSGSFNRLTISNGAQVANQAAFFAFNSFSSNNEATVTGAGSLWSNSSSLNVGQQGAGNRLVISNGSRVISGSGVLGLIGPSSSNNTVVVTGPGSTWNNQTNLEIGQSGANCRLVISNAAFVDNAAGRIGFSGNNGEVVVNGAGSVWSNRTSLTIGESGHSARLVVTNSGSVFALGDVLLGSFSLSNRIVVDNGTLRATNAAGTAALAFNHGTNQFNAGLIEADFLRMTNALGFFEFNSGLLTTRGAFISNGAPFVVGANGTTPALWEVRAGVSNYFLSSDLYIGSNAPVAQLLVTNGAALNNSNGFVGFMASSSNNFALLNGAQSVWTNRGSLTVGNSGSGNRLIVTNGALLGDGDGFIGLLSGSSSNSVIVSGTNSVWTNRAFLTVGNRGMGNMLVISNGGLVVNTTGVLGRENVSSSSNNLVLVSGSGSVWSNSLDLDVGNFMTSNRLVIEAGGLVSCDNGRVGTGSGANNNEAVVTGPGSLWTNRSATTIGLSGSANRLVVSNGASVRSLSGSIGATTFAFNNQVVVTGTGSTWSNAGMTIGTGGAGNRVDVSGGGAIFTSKGTVGDFGFNNTVFLTDSGSVWNSQNALNIGDGGGGNLLVASNGATVLSSNVTIGASTSAGNDNLALITGAGTVWSNQSFFHLGDFGTGNRLVMNNGAAMAVGSNVVIGLNAGANSNSVSVTDPGTRWLVTSNVYVGTNGAFNLLVVSNGGLVANSSGIIGSGATSSNNLALVTGAGSAWSNVVNFVLGEGGKGNQLVASNGATVYVGGNGVIGVNNSAISNSILLTDAGTRWQMAPGAVLNVGSNSSFSRLVISNGAVANCQDGYLGRTATSGTNEAVVTGPGSAWNLELTLFLGLSGGVGNRLTIANGGVVNSRLGQLLGSNCEAIVTGPGSAWNNQQDVYVGFNAGGNRLVITNGGLVVASNNVFLGSGSSVNSRLIVDGGTLRAADPFGFALLDVRRGTNVLNAGLIEADHLQLTNAAGLFEFNGGLLSSRNSTVNNGQPFRVGNGVSPATFALAGDGVHSFANGLTVSSNAILAGNGYIGGVVTVSSGGKLSPGAGGSAPALGKIILESLPSLQGAVLMEISKNGAILSNDQVQVTAPLTYGGSLTVSNLGPTALAAGDNFRLFVASSYAGSFSSLTLPVLGPELIWTNKLLVDGSIEVLSILPGDHFWTNALGGSYGVPDNWLPNSVPGPRDNANFTNNAGYQVAWPADASAANAYFNARSGTVTQAIGAAAWSLTNTYIVGNDSAATAVVTHVSGVLRVTNSAGGARLVIGGSGRGTYNLNGGDVVTDYFFATNNSPSVTNSTFNFNFGNLTTLQGSVVTQNTSFVIGSVSNQTATWTMPSGTNVIALDDSSETVLGNLPGSSGVVMASGGSTVWSNSSSLVIGGSGSASQLLVSNGTKVFASSGAIGSTAGSTNNAAMVTGAGSLWSSAFALKVGDLGGGNRLVVSNGGRADSPVGQIGTLSSSTNNEAVVTGPGSFWTIPSTLFVGYSGNGNRLVVSNGGHVDCIVTYIGLNTSSSNNEALMTGAGSTLSCSAILNVGQSGSGNRVVVTNGGVVSTDSVIVGNEVSSTNNRVTVDGGTLRATNVSGVGVLDVRRGTNVLNGGLIEVDQFLLTNTLGRLEFNAGTLSAKNSQIGNGTFIRIGNGISPATFNLAGNGFHDWSAVLAVSISSNAVLAGNGSLKGGLVISSGGSLSPGSSIGKIVLTNSPSLQGKVLMEFSKNGATLTNDQIQVNAALTYGGSLTLTDLGPDALAAGDNFKLFNAASYAGSFTVMLLPTLAAGLAWTNKLLTDGSLEVVALPSGDRYWTNSLGGDYNVASNWLSNALPAPRDAVHFTSNGTYQVVWPNNLPAADAFFDAAGGSVTQVFSSWWGVTNSYIVGRDAATTAAVAHAIGALRVTNAFGTASLRIGESGNGTYHLIGGDIVADLLIATNTTAGRTNSFNLNHGTLTTLRGATIDNGDHFVMGNTPGQTAAWTIAGGTNRIAWIASQETRLGSLGQAVLMVTGNTTQLTNAVMQVGFASSFNQLVVSNGGRATSRTNTIGLAALARTNTVVVTGAGSLWSSSGDTIIGGSGSSSQLLVTNAGTVACSAGVIGLQATSSNNLVTITGAGSLMTNVLSLHVGWAGSSNGLVIGTNALVVTPLLGLGKMASATNAFLTVSGGNLIATNVTGNGVLQIGDAGSGTLISSNGLIQTDWLFLTNARSAFNFNGGTLQARNTLDTNGSLFAIGDGTSAATFELVGNGTHNFGSGLLVRTNALLTGNGTLSGGPIVLAGTLSPGLGIGRLVMTNSLSLQGTLLMELDKGDTRTKTNDVLQVFNSLTYGGLLIMTNLGSAPLTIGDRFQLFSGTNYSGAFSAMNLPRPGPGLNWANKLLLDGSIELVPWSGPRIDSISVSGTNLFLRITDGLLGGAYEVLASTNIATPLTNWTILSSGTFDWLGTTTITNAITAGEPERFFRARIP